MRGESHRYTGRGPAGYGYAERDEDYAGRWAQDPYLGDDPDRGYDDLYRRGDAPDREREDLHRRRDDARRGRHDAQRGADHAYRGRDDSHRGADHAYRGADDAYAEQSADWGYWEDDEEAEYYRPDPATGGADGNERLTGLIGMVLLVLFAAEGFTILAIHQLLTLHFFLGMLLIGPVLLKVCSTGYRFIRYYTGDAEYRRKGPPALPLRVLGPLVMLTSLAVIGTGVMLAFTGPGASIWLVAHKASFVLWFGVMTVHVLAYVWRLPRLVGGDLATRAGHRAQEVLGGRAARWLLLAASLLTGLLLAVITVHLAGHWVAVPSQGR